MQLQGGDPRVVDDPTRLPTARHQHVWKAPRAGTVARLDAGLIGRAATLLGAGRLRKEDGVDPAVGIIFHAKQGHAVDRGQPIATVHYNDAGRWAAARPLLDQAIGFSARRKPIPTTTPRLVLERLT